MGHDHPPRVPVDEVERATQFYAGPGGGIGGGGGGGGGGGDLDRDYMGRSATILTRSEFLELPAAARGLPSHAGDRAAIARDVFRPGHVLPTMTIEEAGEMEYRELTERTARGAKGTRGEAEREEAGMTEEEREERALAKARTWDEFKDDNPFGRGTPSSPVLVT